MTRRAIAVNRVAATGAVIGLISLLPGWLVVRPNRLTSGDGVGLWQLGLELGAAMTAVWLACLVLAMLPRKRIALAIVAADIPLVVLFLAGMGARRLMAGTDPIARVSLGAGFWLALLAAYLLVYRSSQRLPAHSARWLIAAAFTAPACLLASGWLNDLSITREVIGQAVRFRQEVLQHIWLSGISVGLGILLGIPLGVLAVRSRRAGVPVFLAANVAQTIPSLALFGLMIAPLSALSFAFPVLREAGIRGVGAAPAIIALTIYSLLPIVRNTYEGLRQTDSAITEAARGMGMTRAQVLRRVQAPLAAPVVAEGVRIASVQAVGNTAVAALIGAGGLGWFIFQGIGQAAPDLILAGAIPIVTMALVTDALMRLVVRAVTPRGTP